MKGKEKNHQTYNATTPLPPFTFPILHPSIVTKTHAAPNDPATSNAHSDSSGVLPSIADQKNGAMDARP